MTGGLAPPKIKLVNPYTTANQTFLWNNLEEKMFLGTWEFPQPTGWILGEQRLGTQRILDGSQVPDVTSSHQGCTSLLGNYPAFATVTIKDQVKPEPDSQQGSEQEDQELSSLAQC